MLKKNYHFEQFNSLTQTLLNEPLGFRLTNGTIITANTFFTVIYNISTIFFLISKQIDTY